MNEIDYSEEVWKDVNTWEGFYQVSSFGRVRRDGNLLRPIPSRNGYLRVNFTCGPRRERFTIHRLVACAFIGNPENKPQVNHRNGDKKHNHVINLEWATHQENSDHAWQTGLIDNCGEGNPRAKITNKTAAEVLIRLQMGETGASIARHFGVGKSTICRINRGKAWTHI